MGNYGTILSRGTDNDRFVIVVSSSLPRGISVPYFPDRNVYYLFYYMNRDLGDEVIGIIGKNIGRMDQ